MPARRTTRLGRMRAAMFNLTAFTLIAVAISGAFAPPEAATRRAKRKRKREKGWITRCISALKNLSPTLETVRAFFSEPIETDETQNNSPSKRRRLQRVRQINAMSSSEESATESEEEDEDDEDQDSSSSSEESEEDYKELKGVAESRKARVSPKRQSRTQAESIPRRTASQSSTGKFKDNKTKDKSKPKDNSKPQGLGVVLGQIATSSYKFYSGDCVEFMAERKIYGGSVVSVQNNIAQVQCDNKSFQVKTDDLWLLYDGTTYGSLRVQERFDELSVSSGISANASYKGNVVIVHGETNSDDEIDASPEYWIGIVQNEREHEVSYCPCSYLFKIFKKSPSPFLPVAMKIEIKFLRQLIKMAYSESSTRLVLDSKKIYFTFYEEATFMKSWREATILKKDVLYMANISKIFKAVDVGQAKRSTEIFELNQ